MRAESKQPLFINSSLSVELAGSRADIIASQRLRYQVFAVEQGARLPTAAEKLDYDYYDDFCHHLLVRERNSGDVVASTRILTDTSAGLAGSYYSDNEFDLSALLPLQGAAIEIGRTCVREDYRNGSGIAMLWLGLAQFIQIRKIDFMFGCASVDMLDGGQLVQGIRRYLAQENLQAPGQYQVTPHNPLLESTVVALKPDLPPLLRTYLKLGAWVVGEPSRDEDFGVADFFILLDLDNLNLRFQRFFMRSMCADNRRTGDMRQA